MWKRLKISMAKLLLRRTECTIVRTNALAAVERDAALLREYVDRSGALQDSGRIHAWRHVYALSTQIRDQAIDSEVMA